MTYDGMRVSGLWLLQEINMLEGTLDYAGLVIGWQADHTEDDGFYWSITGVTTDQPYTLSELAEAMLRNHDGIDKAVRAAFEAACQDAADDALLYAAGF